MRVFALFGLSAFAAACLTRGPEPIFPNRWTVAVSPDAPEAVRWTADEVAEYLGRMVTLQTDAGPLTLSGDLATQAIVLAIVSIGGFDEAGARALVAATLGYTPDSLRERVRLAAVYEVR